MNRKSSGFTLAELLIVIAVIAVLVAVAIPVFTSQAERAREATCLANRTSLLHEVTYAMMLADDPDAVIAQFSDQVILDKGYVCPDAGGGIHVRYEPVAHKFTVYCARHGGLDVSYDFGDTVSSFMKGKLGEKLVELLGTKPGMEHIDSSAPSGGNFTKHVTSTLEELTNHSLGKGMTTTWSLGNINRVGKTIQENYQVYWSSADIKDASCKAGDRILMMKYDASTKKYSAVWAPVETHKDSTVAGGEEYKIITQSGAKAVEGSTSEKFMDAYQSFLKELEKNGGSAHKPKTS